MQVNHVTINIKNINEVIKNQRIMLRYLNSCKKDLLSRFNYYKVNKRSLFRDKKAFKLMNLEFSKSLLKLKHIEKSYQRGLSNIRFVENRLNQGIDKNENWVYEEFYHLDDCNGFQCSYAKYGNVDYSDTEIALPFILKYVHNFKMKGYGF